MSNKKYKHLLESGYIGSVRTRSRMLKMGAHPGFFEYEDGYIQQKVIDYYEALAKGGIGLVTVGAAPIGPPAGRAYRMDDDKYLPGMIKLVNAIREQGAPVFLQMFHIGPWLPEPLAMAASSLSPDEIPIQSYPHAKELNLPEIRDIVNEFGIQAERAKRAGFQGVEINAGCSHLLNGFLSRAWNKRKDEYGGSLENRARIVVEIIQEIKKQSGNDFAVIVLYNIVEPGIENGIDIEEGKAFARIFEAAGADAIHARIEFYMSRKVTGNNDSTHFPDVAFFPEPPAYATRDITDISRHGEGGWIPVAAAVKDVVKIPVIGTGRLDPKLGERLIKRGVLDFINLNRRVMSDHEFPNKTTEGRPEDIAPCTACMTCFNQVEEGLPPKCRINASFGKEKEYEIKPAGKKKNVVVIGGGPAGMEAARVAALRGHRVTLFEKEPMLGGSMNLAVIVKGHERENLIAITEYLETQMKKAGVDIRTGKEAGRAMIERLNPDTLIIAVGARHNIPDIPGIDNKNVLTSEALHNQLKNYLKLTGTKMMTRLVSLTNYLPLGKKVVLIGGALQGCQTAEFLVKRGRKVTIVEPGDEIGQGLLKHLIKPQLLDWLDKKDTVKITGAVINEITDKGLVITTKDGNKQIIEADTVVTTLPMLPNNSLFNSLQDAAPEVYSIGDCNNPNLIVDAVADGSRIARII